MRFGSKPKRDLRLIPVEVRVGIPGDAPLAPPQPEQTNWSLTSYPYPEDKAEKDTDDER